ncbi:MAG: recombination mediator RecR [Neisseriaceae bacterium]
MSDAFTRLAHALEVLPNIGAKSAQRIAYHLLQHNRKGTENLIKCLQEALKQVSYCNRCNTFCESNLCEICADPRRDQSKLMIVQMPLDVQIMESANCHDGLYFVLMGAVQPLQNMDLNSVAIRQLLARLEDNQLREIILGTNFNAEGETTAFVLQEILKKFSFRVTRLAKGIPLGGELEFVDAGTLAQAFYERKLIGI